MIMDGTDVSFHKCAAVGVAVVLFCDSSFGFGVVDTSVLYSFICVRKSIFFIDVLKIPKKPAKSLRTTLGCQFICLCIAHVV